MATSKSAKSAKSGTKLKSKSATSGAKSSKMKVGAVSDQIKPAKGVSVKTGPDALSPSNSWLQDATLEIPVSPGQAFAPGSRELEFSVGFRQQEDGQNLRSELRGRALVHVDGQVLALVEASYVNLAAKGATQEDLPHLLYALLRPQLEQLLALGGHKPPLPASLDKVD